MSTEPSTLPRDPAAAESMREQLMADSEYVKDWQTNQAKQNELAYLRFVSRGGDPDAWGRPAGSVVRTQSAWGKPSTGTEPSAAQQAQARIEARATDPQFAARVAARDPVAFAENTRDWRIAHGMTPEPVAPINTTDVMTETIGRELEDVQRRADSLRADGFNEPQIYQYLNGRPIPFREHQFHERELRVLKSDQAFVQRFLAGDLSARAELRRHNAALTMRVGTLAEIDAWDRAHAEQLKRLRGG
jgi:hypothetical protein